VKRPEGANSTTLATLLSCRCAYCVAARLTASPFEHPDASTANLRQHGFANFFGKYQSTDRSAFFIRQDPSSFLLDLTENISVQLFAFSPISTRRRMASGR
jgi:hypothetical protein